MLAWWLSSISFALASIIFGKLVISAIEALTCDLDEASLVQDLKRIWHLYNVKEMHSTLIEKHETVNYYKQTTDRDYKVLQFFSDGVDGNVEI